MGGRLGVRLLIVVLLSVIAIETAILIPSYLGYQRELQDRLEHVGQAIVVTALKPRNHESDEDRLNYARLAARFSELSGGFLYRLDGSLIGHFGEKPDLSPDDANGRPMLARMTGNGKNLDVVWSAAELAAILEIAPEGVITIDHNMTITMFNLTAERIFGYSAEEIMGQRFDRLMPERFRRGHGDLVETFSRSSETARYMDQRGDIYGLRKDGTEFPAGASVSKLILGPDRFYTVMIRDITAQKRILDELISAKNEAEIANLTKSEFLASMSHKLRTPLNAILGFSDIMRNEYLGPLGADQYLEYVEDIHSSGDHLLSLLSDLLDISAIEAGKMAIKKQVLNVEEIAAESLKIISLNAQGKVISLVSSIAGQLPDLLADKRSIKQILINLLTNAVKYTPEGGEISLTVAATESEMTFTVADNGQGIPPDQLPYLTDPLTRYEKDPMHANEGWGLGLAITHSLVGLHQGNMKIESETGVGTTVIVTILLNTP